MKAMKWRLTALLMLVGIAATASANGAMGLALEMFEWRTWSVYVAVTIVLEALIIGRAASLNWGKSLGISLLANFITAGFCASGCFFAPVLHGSFVGSAINPNPFWNSVALLTIYGLISALIEAFIWAGFVDKDRKSRTQLASLAAHGIGIPVALAILLIPDHPYRGLERTTDLHRMRFVIGLRDAFGVEIAETNRIPAASSASDLIAAAARRSNDHVADAWAAGYKADFERFDTHEMKRIPLDINPAVLGRAIESRGDERYWVWLLRYRFGGRQRDDSLAVDLRTGEVQEGRFIQPLGTIVHDK